MILKNLSNLLETFVEGYLRGQGMLMLEPYIYFYMWKIYNSNHNIMNYHFNSGLGVIFFGWLGVQSCPIRQTNHLTSSRDAIQ